MTPYSWISETNKSNVYESDKFGGLYWHSMNHEGASYGFDVRPAIVVDGLRLVEDGDNGTISNPYKLSVFND